MKMSFRLIVVLGILLGALFAGAASVRAETPVVELDDFIVEESARTAPESFSPVEWPVPNLFGVGRSLAETPRSLTLVTPEAMRRLEIRGLEDLPKAGPGTQRINYFGLAGTPVLRGTRAGLYFNGMLRAYQRNEMPTSLGSADALSLVRGPAPAHFSPTLVGGFVDLQPKQPFFDAARGRLELTVGSWDEYRLQLDHGAPFVWGRRPAAYRASVTVQRADSYFDNVSNDFESIYFALRSHLSPQVGMFVGGEVYRHRSSEVPGINRPTQALIDTGRYVIGEPAPLVSDEWGGRVARTLVEYPFTFLVDPRLHALALPGHVVRERVPTEFRHLLLDLNDPANVDGLYRLRPAAEVPGFVYGGNPAVLEELRAMAAASLAGVSRGPQDLFVYTEAYLAAGGPVITEELPRSRTLVAPEDFADADNGIFFLDFESRGSAPWSWTNRTFVEALRTNKRSTYGFAFSSRQALAENQTRLRRAFEEAEGAFSVGLSLRASHARMVQDFDAEPFSRRDLSRREISPNTLVAAGDERGLDGNNLWATFGGASGRSLALQTALFSELEWQPHARWQILAGARAERVGIRRSLPAFIDNQSAADRERLTGTDDMLFANGSGSVIFEAIEDTFLYVSGQRGRALAPGDGGTLFGETSLPTADLLETGIKSGFLDNRLFAALAIYRWNQSVFSNRDAYAQPLRGEGVEAELYANLTPAFTLAAHFTAQRVYRRSERIGFGAFPQDEAGWALNGGILNAGDRAELPNNPDRVQAGSPEVTARIFGLYEWENGWSLSGGVSWRDAFWSDIARTLRLPSATLVDARLAYARERWDVALSVQNALNEAYWAGADPIFAAGTLLTPGLPRQWRLQARWHF